MPAAPPSTAADPAAIPQAGDLLAWYDRHRRRLPWRAEPGQVPDPYRVWLSEIMLQQTTTGAVRPYYERFLDAFPSVEALAAAPSEAVMRLWAGLGYYSRARNLHECARVVVERHGGRFPEDEAALRALPGIGAYTAAAVAAIAFGRRAVVVDGNVERVMARLHAIETPMPRARREIGEGAARLTPQERPGDYAQAVMDLGATICTPRRPACALCPWMAPCRARAAGAQERYPVKGAKRDKPGRRGAAFVALDRDGRLLVRTRAPSGLLGGMTEVPTSDWSEAFEAGSALEAAPFPAAWRRLPAPALHGFTHFDLALDVYVARIEPGVPAPGGMRWIGAAEIADEALPTVFRRVVGMGMEALGEEPPVA